MKEIRPYLGRYALILVLTWGGLMVLGQLLLRFAGFSLPGGAVAVLPPMIAALSAGQLWGRETGAVPPNGPAWRLAALGGGIYFLLQLVVIGGIFASLSRTRDGVATPEVITTTLGLIAVLCLIAVLISRLFLSIGGKSAQRR